MAVTTTTSISTKGEASQQRSSETSLFTLSDFLFKSSLDNINLYKLLRYCSRSKISLKLNGFVEKCEVSLNDSAKKSSLIKFLQEIKNPVSTRDNAHLESPNKVMSRSPLMHIESFLWSLTSSSKDGRIVVTTGTDPTLKFLLLNPASHFKKILDECRSLIVAGGTMQPSSSMIDQLIGRPEPIDHRLRIVEFSCGHVIDGASQLLPLVLGSGPSNEVFRFTFEKRASAKLITELGRMLLNMINVIPGGVVCFFPSYEYENLVYDQWLKEGLTTRMELRKKIFREPKKSNQVDQLLAEYAKCIERTSASAGRQSGAILLSVVGGKMSEGINFSDDLGRCIVMVGLPYPNMHSPELKEKIAYLNTNMPPHSDGRTAGQVYYESLCMKAVNQSIGRAIRHRNDYACLLLVDSRYSKPSVAHKLPEWIGKHLKAVSGFGQAFSAVRKFFNDKKT